MGPLFDAYVMVDWSAASRPTQGKDSIWLALITREGEEIAQRELLNFATRAAATEWLGDRLCALADAGKRALVGFDFPFGYPAGAAAALRLSGPPWRAMWEEIARLVADDAQNVNTRFDAAEDLNRRLSGEAFPFWGHGERDPQDRRRERERAYLRVRGRRPHSPSDLPERRICDARVGRAQSVWKLAGAGSPGGQTLTGIPRVLQLRERLGDRARIWPFETGLRPLDPAALGAAAVIFAEIYPSMYPQADLVPKDAAQVVGTARALAERDRAGELGALFAGDPALTEAERKAVAEEEAWMLGVDGPVVFAPRRRASDRSAKAGARLDYLRDPAEIYRRSFDIVRAETRLDGFPHEIAAVVERLVHACGMPDIVDDLAFTADVAGAAREALARGATIVCDARMVAAGIRPCANRIVVAQARQAAPGETRAAAGMSRARLGGAVVAIGNAPTALFRLIERIQAGAPRPAAILAFPVGFVGAAESKEALIAASLGVPYMTLRGRRGGSALAAAALNALLTS